MKSLFSLLPDRLQLWLIEKTARVAMWLLRSSDTDEDRLLRYRCERLIQEVNNARAGKAENHVPPVQT